MVSASENTRIDSTIVMCFALLSFVGSIVLIFTFYIRGMWKFEHKGTKRIILVMSVLTAVHSLALTDVSTDKSPPMCTVQSAAIQLFGVGSIMLQAAMSLESYLALQAIMSESSVESTEVADARSKMRFQVYMAVVAVYNAVGVTVITMGNYEEAYGSVSFICYASTGWVIFVFGAIPLMAAAAIMVYCNSVILVRLLSLYKVSSSSDAVDDGSMGHSGRASFTSAADSALRNVRSFYQIYMRLTTRARLTLYRMMILPPIYLAILVVMGLYVAVWLHDNETAGVIAVCASVSSGLVNFAVWVALDGDVLQEWYLFFYYSGSDQRRKLHRAHTKQQALREARSNRTSLASALVQGNAYREDDGGLYEQEGAGAGAGAGAGGSERQSHFLEQGHARATRHNALEERPSSPGSVSISSGADSDDSSFMLESVYSAPDLLNLHSNHGSSAALSAAANDPSGRGSRPSDGDNSIVSGITEVTTYSSGNARRQASSATTGSGLGRSQSRGRQSSVTVGSRYRSRRLGSQGQSQSYSNIGGFIIMRPSLTVAETGPYGRGSECIVTGITAEDLDDFEEDNDASGSEDDASPRVGPRTSMGSLFAPRGSYVPPIPVVGSRGSLSRPSSHTLAGSASSPGPENRSL